jgi:hypothetical protein
VGFGVNNVALGQVFSEYFGFTCQTSFHQLLHNHHHLSFGAGTRCQTVAALPSGLSHTNNNNVTDLLKALRDSGRQAADCLGSGDVVLQHDDATVLWKRFLRVDACTCDVMLYGACAGDVRQQ